MTPDQLAAAAAHSREAITAIAHIAREGGVGGMTYVMTSAEDVPGLLAHAEGLQRVVDDQEARLIAQVDRIIGLEERTTAQDATISRLEADHARDGRLIDRYRIEVEKLRAKVDELENGPAPEPVAEPVTYPPCLAECGCQVWRQQCTHPNKPGHGHAHWGLCTPGRWDEPLPIDLAPQRVALATETGPTGLVLDETTGNVAVGGA